MTLALYHIIVTDWQGQTYQRGTFYSLADAEAFLPVWQGMGDTARIEETLWSLAPLGRAS